MLVGIVNTINLDWAAWVKAAKILVLWPCPFLTRCFCLQSTRRSWCLLAGSIYFLDRDTAGFEKSTMRRGYKILKKFSIR